MRKLIGSMMVVLMASGCAVLHHVQVGEVDSTRGGKLVPFEIKVSETGVELREVTALQRSLFRDNRNADKLGNIAAIISLFQMGPRTGAPVYTDKYAEDIERAIFAQCSSGMITGLQSIREMRKYPVISGEIVKIKGFCINDRKPASPNEKADDVEADYL